MCSDEQKCAVMKGCFGRNKGWCGGKLEKSRKTITICGRWL